MNLKQHNFDAECKRKALESSFKQSGGKHNGKADDMRPSTDWRETFKLWGYVPCLH